MRVLFAGSTGRGIAFWARQCIGNPQPESWSAESRNLLRILVDESVVRALSATKTGVLNGKVVPKNLKALSIRSRGRVGEDATANDHLKAEDRNRRSL